MFTTRPVVHYFANSIPARAIVLCEIDGRVYRQDLTWGPMISDQARLHSIGKAFIELARAHEHRLATDTVKVEIEPQYLYTKLDEPGFFCHPGKVTIIPKRTSLWQRLKRLAGTLTQRKNSGARS